MELNLKVTKELNNFKEIFISVLKYHNRYDSVKGFIFIDIICLLLALTMPFTAKGFFTPWAYLFTFAFSIIFVIISLFLIGVIINTVYNAITKNCIAEAQYKSEKFVVKSIKYIDDPHALNTILTQITYFNINNPTEENIIELAPYSMANLKLSLKENDIFVIESEKVLFKKDSEKKVNLKFIKVNNLGFELVKKGEFILIKK